jgi:hypothetical protein
VELQGLACFIPPSLAQEAYDAEKLSPHVRHAHRDHQLLPEAGLTTTAYASLVPGTSRSRVTRPWPVGKDHARARRRQSSHTARATTRTAIAPTALDEQAEVQDSLLVGSGDGMASRGRPERGLSS